MIEKKWTEFFRWVNFIFVVTGDGDTGPVGPAVGGWWSNPRKLFFFQIPPLNIGFPEPFPFREKHREARQNKSFGELRKDKNINLFDRDIYNVSASRERGDAVCVCVPVPEPASVSRDARTDGEVDVQYFHTRV